MKLSTMAALIMACALAPTSAHASDCVPDLVSLVGWSAKARGYEPGMPNGTRITLGLKNHGPDDIVMIEGSVIFTDALGNMVEPSPVSLSPDTHIPANSPGNVVYLSHDGVSRLTSIEKHLVSAELCISALVTSDGTVVRPSK